MRRRLAFAAVIAVAVLVSMCQKKPVKDGPVVKIGSKVVTQSSFEAFRTMKKLYPVRMGSFFPGARSEIAFLIEAELLNDKAQPLFGVHRAVAGNDWKWKQKYFSATLYMTQVLEKDLGVTEREIQAYYNAHKESYKDTVTKYQSGKKAKASPGDTAKGKSDTTIARDSIYYRGLAEVRSEIAEKLFLQSNPPDSAFAASLKKDDSTITVQRIGKSWINTCRRTLPDFFAKMLYKKMYGKALSDSSWSGWFGKGKVITQADLDVILNWIPSGQRQSYSSDSLRLRELAKWLLKWELLSAEAERKGFARSKESRMVVEWARKAEVAMFQVDSVLRPTLSKGLSLDTAMCLYGYWDDRQTVENPPDRAGFVQALDGYFLNEVGLRLDSLTYQMRVRKGVKFLQPDWRDDRDKDPVKIAAQADSARDSGNTQKAESLYSMLITSFAFLPQGQHAMSEQAKILTEKERYYEAIKHYRLQLVTGLDKSKRCNTFFMIGFIYDEYLSKPELAEANYKWVLKNTPECELADDAEFMCLHLDEPMTSVEELRGEAHRQGRKVEEDQPAGQDSASTASVKADSSVKKVAAAKK